MRIFIAGVDGYLGWSLCQYLVDRGHVVGGADKYYRRQWVEEMGGDSAIKIYSMTDRLKAFEEIHGTALEYWEGDLRDYTFVEKIIDDFKPDAIVHLAECPSAPYSMIDVNHAVYVQTNNIETTFNLMFALKEVNPEAHLLKLGTMGEYGTPNVDIPEGFYEIDYNGRSDRLPFPRQAGSWYHQSKVHGSNNIMLASKIWGLTATDIMQGVVFGTRINVMQQDERLRTRLDFDHAFGTAINRFCCQAVIGEPLTLYGTGGQRRGFLPLKDSMQCLTLALENPPKKGEYRVFNQFEQVYSISDLALKVQEVASSIGIDVDIRNIKNPRVELEKHYYNPEHQGLFDLGYIPSDGLDADIKEMLQDLAVSQDRIRSKSEVLLPDINWDGSRSAAQFI